MRGCGKWWGWLDLEKAGWVMGFRMRKSFKIMPGLRLNVSKSGVSATVGKAGACVNLSSRGARATVGVPGTGISYSTKLGGKKGQTQTLADMPPDTGPKPKKPVSWLGRIGLWFLFCLPFGPLFQEGVQGGPLIGLAGSVVITWLVVKWINKKRGF